MKKLYPIRKWAFRNAFFVLLFMAFASAVTAQNQVPTGAINGLFSINYSGSRVYFSQGNLQYIGSAAAPYWKFADHQWDYLGTTTNQNSSNSNVDRDLFGWGTSGYNHGANSYRPWSTSTSNSDYYAYGSQTYNLNDQTGQADWGYNPISNGGNTADTWRTLTKAEWDYVFNTRVTTSGIRYAKATVNNICGVILLPDDWNAAYYPLSNTNASGASFSINAITPSLWLTLEQHGAVFLPAAGYRNGTSVGDVGSGGNYWSASYSNSNGAYSVYFDGSSLLPGYDGYRSYGRAVRLVRPAQNGFAGINASPNPAEGGVVSGGGAYQQGADCTLTATPIEGFDFLNWTVNGEVVSTDAVYTFPVTSDVSVLANFVTQENTSGELNGLFAVGNNTWVHFSQGNLQYIGSVEDPYWKFAEHQWDFLAHDGQGSNSQTANRDLFGWGTSGYEHGAVKYLPWSTSTTNSDYYAYGSANYNLSDLTHQADWGYNAIINGGDTINSWRSLTKDEWVYLFETRNTQTGIRYAKAQVNGFNGVVLLPDDWRDTYYHLNNANKDGVAFTTNTISASSWKFLEVHGAVFLPAAGYRNGTSLTLANAGYYWSSSSRNNDYAYGVSFNASSVYSGSNSNRSNGQSVRLVRTVQNVTFSVNAIPNPAEGGTMTGGGEYEPNTLCTLTASGNADYQFLNWTLDGAVVSTNATYSFTVTKNANPVANFVPRGSNNTGILYGAFSVGVDSQVQFSQGNLQYIGSVSTPYWKFAEHQWDYLGNNGQGFGFQTGNRDLFGWGTSGYNHGANCYQPWSTSTSDSDYCVYGNSSYNLYDQTGQADWGYNAISNGGNQENSGWRTLTNEEWKYLFNTRTTSSGIRYAKAKVNGVNGVILLPDDWQTSYYSLSGANSFNASYNNNILTASQWATLEQHGAVFLPAAGHRDGTTVTLVGSDGSYWSASLKNNYHAYNLYFYRSFLGTGQYNESRYYGHSVRLVRAAQTVSYGINASPNPAEGGVVSGGGAYQAGAECTLTATPSAGYTFNCWTENGEVVSEVASYSFVVVGNRNLVANFNEILTPTENHFIPEEDAYEDNMTFTALIQIDGVEQYSEMLEVGAFCGMECRGSQRASYFSPTQRYIVQLTVFGETGDQIDFRLYDHTAQQELELASPAPVSFSTNGYGSLANPYVLNFTSTVLISAEVNPEGAATITGTGNYAIGATATLTANANTGFQFFYWTLNDEVVSSDAVYEFTVTETAHYVAHFISVHHQALINGWNWWSTYVELEGNDGLNQLENSIGNNGLIIKSRTNGYVETYQENGETSWYGNLSSICNEQMYKIRTNAVCNAVIVGDPALPANHHITIKSGWNWIGYPCNSQTSVEVAMAGFNPEPNDILKGRNSYTTYYSEDGTSMWYGTLNTLEPGKGYMYRSNSTIQKTLTFQPNRGETTVENALSENNYFHYSDGDFADNMTVTAVVELGGEEVRSEDYEVAAFMGEECRGSVKLMYVEPINRYVAFLSVFGTPSETLRFRLTDGTQTSLSINEISFVSDGATGSLSNPVVLRFGNTGLNENESATVAVYPNPSEGLVIIQGQGILRVEVVNAMGQVIHKEAFAGDAVELNLSQYANGVYLLRMVTNNGVINKQWIKR